MKLIQGHVSYQLYYVPLSPLSPLLSPFLSLFLLSSLLCTPLLSKETGFFKAQVQIFIFYYQMFLCTPLSVPSVVSYGGSPSSTLVLSLNHPPLPDVAA